MTKKVVQDNGSISVIWADENNVNYQDTKLVVWTLKKCKNKENAYYIEQLYGEVKPRMMCSKEDPQLWSNLQCNRKKTPMYEETCWIIEKTGSQQAAENQNEAQAITSDELNESI